MFNDTSAVHSAVLSPGTYFLELGIGVSDQGVAVPFDLTVTLSHYTGWSVLPTGQDRCYSGDTGEELIECPGVAGESSCASTLLCGQDAQYSSEARTYSVRTIDDDTVVEDPLTGLMWTASYASCSAETWSDAISSCELLSFGGYSDWRLPAIDELSSIVDYGRFDPALDPSIFESYSRLVWSSTPVAFNSDVWKIYEDSGRQFADENPDGCVRCVRGDFWGQELEGRYVVSGSEELVFEDQATGLIWQDAQADVDNWESALSYCEQLTHGGHSDWRLPNINELLTLVNKKLYTPASTFPGEITFPCSLWSSTSYIDNEYGAFAWVVSLGGGGIERQRKEDFNPRALCVR